MRAIISEEIADTFCNDSLNGLLIHLNREVPYNPPKMGDLIMATIYPMTLNDQDHFEFAAWRQDVESEGEIHNGVLSVCFAEEAKGDLIAELN